MSVKFWFWFHLEIKENSVSQKEQNFANQIFVCYLTKMRATKYTT